MKLIRIFAAVALALAAVVLADCGEKKFKVEGDIAGADDASVVVEKADASGKWVAIDSTRTSGSGKFSISIAAPAAPEIYRLDFGGSYIYFPVDSVETVSVKSSARAFATDFSLSGSKNAEAMARFDKGVNALPQNADAATLDAFKRQVFNDIIRPMSSSVVSYYVLTKTRDGRPLFDPKNPEDAKYYGAVATAYEQYKPDDPRTAMLKEITLGAMRNAASAKGKKTVLRAQEVKFFDAAFPDAAGNVRKLSDVVGKGRPVLLVFTVMGDQNSPAYNAEIRKIHDAGRADIYMIGLDPDIYVWRRAVANLPWTNVYATEADAGEILRNYNVTTLPVAFVIDAAGNLTQRADDPAQINL